MQLEHQFEVPVPVAQAWEVLLDVERIAPCMPGATVDSFDGETVEGRVKVKVGPIQVTYAGTARFTEQDAEQRRVVVEATGKEARGAGTARATIVSAMREQGPDRTLVTVTTDLAITGKPAQFGRGVMVEVGNKLIGRFADCLAEEIVGPASGAQPAASTETAAAATASDAGAATAAATAGPGGAAPLGRARESESIDLLDTAALPVLKRLLPVLAGLVVLLLWRRLRRRRH